MRALSMFDLLFRAVLCRRGLAALLAVLCVLGCGLPLGAPGVARAQQGGESGDDGDLTPGRPAAWDVVADSVAAPLSPAGARVAAGATDCLGFPTRRIRYTSDGVLHLEGCGQIFTLSDIPAAGIGTDKLELVDRANKI